MGILIGAQELTKSFGARALFEHLSFSINDGERIGLIGPNGAGKSTLLKILAEQISPDSGRLSKQRGLKIGYLEQVPSFAEGGTVYSTVMEASHDPHDWQEMARAQETLSHLHLSGDYSIGPETPVEQLSGGWKKRVALARELTRAPDLLLLDEPTNHLDVESILWLEEFLGRTRIATVTVTHDRLFLQRVANRIIELDRRNPGGLLSVTGTYTDYLETKDSLLAGQEKQEERLKNTLRRETEWLRRGAKARTTKQQARINRHGELTSAVEELTYRNQTATVKIDFQGAEKNPKKLIDAKEISKSYDGVQILPELNLLLTAGKRIGLLGRNGCGKSTLIRLLLGTEKSDTGSVTRSEHLKVSYFEQNRESLDPKKTLLRSICPHGDTVDYCGRLMNAKGYLDRFLFKPGQFELEVGRLSGGEQSRLLIAKLMLKEANLLVLDEPTNDLDAATLDVLADMLIEFPGAVVLVTHDRYFLDQVATQTLGFFEDENGKKLIVPFSGFSQWEAFHDELEEKKTAPKSNASAKNSPAPVAAKSKLTFKEQRELDSMESTIHDTEAKLAELEKSTTAPEVSRSPSKLVEIGQEMSKLQFEIARLYARWEELINKQA